MNCLLSESGEKLDSDAREETEIPTVRKEKLSSVCKTGSKRSSEKIPLWESSCTRERQKRTHWTCGEGETACTVAKEQSDGDKHFFRETASSLLCIQVAEINIAKHNPFL